MTVPALELFILLQLGARIGLINTISLIVVTGALGATLTRQQGLRTLANIKSSMNQGKVPTSDIVDGFLILIAGIVLLTPGIMTDAFGFFLLIPPCRALIRATAIEAFKKNVKVVTPFQQGQQPRQQDEPRRPRPSDDGIIDVEATTVDDDTKN